MYIHILYIHSYLFIYDIHTLYSEYVTTEYENYVTTVYKTFCNYIED